MQRAGARTSRTHHPHGLTLVKSLVILVVASVVLAIVLPALASIRESARNVECLSNLRSIHVGFQGYRNDNDNLIPFVTSVVRADRGFFRPMGVISAQLATSPPGFEGEELVVPGPWFCPSDPDLGTKHGSSYPYAASQICALFRGAPNAQRRATETLDQSSPDGAADATFMEWDAYHEKDSQGAQGRNVLHVTADAERYRFEAP